MCLGQRVKNEDNEPIGRGIMRELPLRTSLADVEVKPAAGQDLLLLYGQILRLLSREKEAEELIHFFAEPQVNKINQVIKWHTKANGEMRRFSELSVERQRAAMTQVGKACQRIQQICGDLTKAQGAHSQNVVALKAMLVTPELQDSLFLVGERVVLTQWGCYPSGQRPSDFDLEVQGKQQVAKLLPPAEKIEESFPVEGASPEKEVVDPPSPTEPKISQVKDDAATEPAKVDPIVAEEKKKPEPPKPVVPEKKRWYWRWLLLLLLLLLLIIGLLLKKWTYPTKHDPALEAAYRAEIAQLWLKVDDKAKTCTPIVPPPPPPPSVPQAPKPPELTPEAMEKGDLGVFKGSWRLVSEMRDFDSKEKIIIHLSFDMNGTGQVRTDMASGRTCTGAASVSISSASQFALKDNGQLCSSGDKYVPGMYECKVRSDRNSADCRITCLDNQRKPTTCDARFERQ